MNKHIKFFTILSTSLVLGGVSALTVLATSCGKKTPPAPASHDLAVLISNTTLGRIYNQESSRLFTAIVTATGNYKNIDLSSCIVTWDNDLIHVTISAKPDGSQGYYGSVICTYIYQEFLPNWGSLRQNSVIHSINLTNTIWDYQNFTYTVHPVSMWGDIFVSTGHTYANYSMPEEDIHRFTVLDGIGEETAEFCSSSATGITWEESFESSFFGLSWNADTHVVTFNNNANIDVTQSLIEYYSFFDVAYFEIVLI